MSIWPTQALETYQCPNWPTNRSDCPENDHPTVAALHVLTERALQLPNVTATQKAKWLALQARLPPIPMTVEDNVTVVSPYSSYPNAQHISNSETPELYSTHPFRYFTIGQSIGPQKRNIDPSIYCLETSKRQTCRNADANTGWVQGSLNAALLGRAEKAAKMTLQRALVSPATGYRFPAFAPHFQDYEPSEDHFANMMSTLQFMLIQPVDDQNGSSVLFPSWPCSWDVDFKLRAPRNTIVSGTFKQGQLQSLIVDPPERKASITMMNCQNVTFL